MFPFLRRYSRITCVPAKSTTERTHNVASEYLSENKKVCETVSACYNKWFRRNDLRKKEVENLMPLTLYRSGRKVPDFFADPIGRISQDTGLADFVQRISRSVS